MNNKISTLLLCCILLIFAAPKLHSQTDPPPFAILTSLVHDTGNGGSVEFTLTGNPDTYNYYWTHGATELALFNLAPGTYTLVVQDFYGCVQEFEVTILLINGCTIGYVVNNGLEPCTQVITLQVYKDGQPVNETDLEITWSDSNPSGLIRVFDSSLGADFCVTISVIGDGGNCVDMEQCFDIAPDTECLGGGDLCELNHTVTDGQEPCTKIIRFVLLRNGIPIDESNLDIRWLDGAPFGLTRYVNATVDGRYCITINTLDPKQSCPEMSECVSITPERECYGRFSEVQGNLQEANGNTTGSEQQTIAGLKNTLTVFPNPFEDQLHIELESVLTGEVLLQVYAVSGQELTSKILESQAGKNSYKLENTTTLPSGTLLLQVTYPSGEKITKRIVRINTK